MNVRKCRIAAWRIRWRNTISTNNAASAQPFVSPCSQPPKYTFTTIFYKQLICNSRNHGWWRFEYEKVLAPSPTEESGEGVARGEESCESSPVFTDTIHLYIRCKLEEKKKLDQLRKEKEEERQLQELQRLQEEQTGKKRTEKLEWMYATPATGSSQNPNDLEDYLLGKKRVDKILTADENAKVSSLSLRLSPLTKNSSARRCTQKFHCSSEREQSKGHSCQNT